MTEFLERFGHEYNDLTQAEKVDYRDRLIEWRATQHPKEKKAGKAALADVNATWKNMTSMVSS